MNVTYSKADVLKANIDGLIVPVAKNWERLPVVKMLDKALGGALIERAKKAEFKGGNKEQFSLDTAHVKFEKLLLIGLGEDDLSSETIWDIAHLAVRAMKAPLRKQLAFAVDSQTGLLKKAALSKLATGIVSGDYVFDKYKKKEQEKNKKRAVTKVAIFASGKGSPTPQVAKAAIDRGVIVGESVNEAKTLVNEPAESMTPVIFANQVKKLGQKAGFTVKVETEAQIKKRKMGLYMAVARGSKNPPRLITMTYAPKGAKGAPVVLVGKGLMYDSGGYSLKPTASMETMKCDMGGAAAVVGAMNALASMKVKRKVIAIVAAAENMIGSNAYRVGDVYTGMNGKTVEVMNTDAEGRLTLADALCYGQSFKPELIVDVATLTGACVVALGEQTTGVFANGEKLEKDVLAAFARAGEDAWPLPLNPRLKPLIKSPIADMKNTGGRWGGATTAGLFLEEFIEEGQDWAHLDIAGPAFQTKNVGHMPTGGSGVAAASLVELVDPSE